MRLIFSTLLLLLVGLQVNSTILDSALIDDHSSKSSEESKCPQDYYFSEDRNRCLECTECGMNMYKKEKCQADQDSVCDWCLTRNPTMNEEYFRQCDDYKQLYQKLRDELKAEISEERQPSGLPSKHWLLRMICILATCCFLVVVFAVGCLCCTRERYTRVVNVQPPELSDVDQHNIIYAAKQIREKLAKRGEVNYEYL